MSDVISYEPETETLRIGAREFDVLHLRSKARSEVLSSINIAMRELHGQTIVGAREVYRDTTIAIVPRMAIKAPITSLDLSDRLLRAQRVHATVPPAYLYEGDPLWLRRCVERFLCIISFGRWFGGR